MGVYIRWNGMVEWNGGMEWWNGILEYWNGIATCAELFLSCLMSPSVQQLFRRSDQWRKTKYAAVLTLLLSLTVTKVVVRAPQ